MKSLFGTLTVFTVHSLEWSTAVLCPLEIQSFKDPSCQKLSDASTTSTRTIEISSINNPSEEEEKESSCQFILDGLYQVTSCRNDVLTLDPCFAIFPPNKFTISNPFVSSKSFTLNSCLTLTRGSYISITGSCIDDNEQDATCLVASQTPTSSQTPSMSPPYSDKNIKAWVELPTPPLAKNTFADQPLDLALAHEVVYLSGIVYRISDEESAKQAKQLLPSDYNFHLWKDTGETEVLVISTNHTEDHVGKVMVLFRGTDITADGDWMTNLKTPKVRFGPKHAILDGQVTTKDMFGFDSTSEIRVHKGYNGVFSDNLYEIVMEVVEPLLKKTNDDGALYYNNTIHYTGHSLGGANAQLFGTYFAFFHPTIDTFITTLAAPRHGNFAYKTLIESLPNLSLWRMVNCRDPVPRFYNMGYYHAGHMMWKRCNPPDEEKLSNDIVEAYYRQSGDVAQGYARTPSSYNINTLEETIAHHYEGPYLEWLSYALLTGGNWTNQFEKVL